MKSPPVVLHVAPTFGKGGRETRTAALMAMMPREIQHLLISLDSHTEGLGGLDPGVNTKVIDRPDRPGQGLFLRIRSLRGILRDVQPDLVLTYNWGAIEWLLAARLTRLPAVVHHEDGFGPEESERQLRRRVWIRRALLPVCDTVIVPSRVLYDIARREWAQPENRLRLLPNGVDLARFRPSKPRPAQREIVFGCVGRIRTEKNQALAVRALAVARCRARARLRLVGDGPELESVQRLATQLGIGDRVEFAGAVDDTAPEYRSLDVFLIPSRTEQMPIALLEAMASGLPVVGTDVGDVREMVAESNRELIARELSTTDGLAAAMDRLADDAALREQLGNANRFRAEEHYELGACYGAYVRIYVDLLKRLRL